MSIRFAVVGMAHEHVFGLTKYLIDSGGKAVTVYAPESERLTRYLKRFPDIPLAGSVDDILNNARVDVVVGIPPFNARAELGIQVMRSGKDYLADKPGFTSLAQLEAVKRVQTETTRKYTVFFGERLTSPVTIKADELVKAGAIGRVIHVIGTGPHRLNPSSRPDWFFKSAKTGGILNDLACHQIDQFLHFSGSTTAQITSARIANFNHPEHPDFEDYGDITLHSDTATGFVRVDWFTPDGLPTWGDVRLLIMGTEGYIELRKNCDLSGRDGGNHLFLVNHAGQQYINCDDVPITFGKRYFDDLKHRTENAISQAHCYTVSELALLARQQAIRIG